MAIQSTEYSCYFNVRTQTQAPKQSDQEIWVRVKLSVPEGFPPEEITKIIQIAANIIALKSLKSESKPCETKSCERKHRICPHKLSDSEMAICERTENCLLELLPPKEAQIRYTLEGFVMSKPGMVDQMRTVFKSVLEAMRPFLPAAPETP